MTRGCLLAAASVLGACTNADPPAKPRAVADEAKFDVRDESAPPEPQRDVGTADEPSRDDAIGDPIAEPDPELTIERSPLGAGASVEARKQSVLEMLSGSGKAAHLPLRVVDEGKTFNPGLADQMTPTVATSSRVPRVRQKTPTIRGELPKDVVRRIVRAHINEVRYCYNQVLVDDKEAGGTITMAFEIDARGKVTAAKSTTKAKSLLGMRACLDKTFLRWKFPKPGDGKAVSVRYPFALTPG